ncbi:MAG: cysteine desulfurase NifS, partial [Spirochaetes bacterium GWF1_41_5]
MHSFGREARSEIETARRITADFLGCRPDEILFTGSGSEANNAVINNIICSKIPCTNKECPVGCGHKNHIITSAIEHPSVLQTCKCQEQRGFSVSYMPVDSDGIINPDDVKAAVKPQTALITVMLANNETGSLQPVKEIAALAKKNGILMHTDAVQAIGKLPVSVYDLGVDFLSLSGHKIYAPKGVGVLYIKNGIPFCPLIYGGHHEQSRRAGTENNIGIIALGRAFSCLKNEMQEETEKLQKLKKQLKTGLLEKIPEIEINGHDELCLPGTLNVSFKYVEGESILLYADMEGIAVSTGSACSSGSLDPSHVLLAMGRKPEEAHGSIRFSLGRENTEKDIDYVLE